MRARSLILSVAFALGLAQGCASPPKAVQGNAGQGGNSGTGGATSSSACPAYVSYSSDAGALAAGHLGSGPARILELPTALQSRWSRCLPSYPRWRTVRPQRHRSIGTTRLATQSTCFVKRYAAAQQPAKGQLWLLMEVRVELVRSFERWVYDSRKVTPHARHLHARSTGGTGMSSFASCATTPNNLSPTLTAAQAATCAACIRISMVLTVTGAAQDLAHIIDATREPSQAGVRLRHVVRARTGHSATWRFVRINRRPSSSTRASPRTDRFFHAG